MARDFELIGGRSCLDFVNTMSGLRVLRPEERLLDYGDLLAWAEQSRLLSRAEAEGLRREAAQHPRRAAEAVAAALSLREALHAVLLAALRGRRPDEGALGAVNGWVAAALQERRLRPTGRGFALRFDERPGELLAFLRPVALSAQELLASDQLLRVHLCAEAEADRCGWIFLDETKNGTRRFCSMRDCGNRAKARRHYARVKEERS